MQDPKSRLREFVDGHEEEIFLRMMVWAENELLPQVHRVNVSGCEVGLFLLTHGFIQTFMEKTYEQRGVGATTAFLKQFIDGARKKDRFSLIGPEMHEMRNVMAHQLYSSRTHDIAFDYRVENSIEYGLPGWQGELSRIERDASGDGLRFEFATSDGYGPVRFDLRRVK